MSLFKLTGKGLEIVAKEEYKNRQEFMLIKTNLFTETTRALNVPRHNPYFAGFSQNSIFPLQGFKI